MATKKAAKKAAPPTKTAPATTTHFFVKPGVEITPLTTTHGFSVQFSGPVKKIAVEQGDNGTWIVRFEEK